MKTSRAQVEQNRENLLKAASQGFRRKGFDGVKVSEIMSDVGLTHGGFYNYFASKEDLAGQACEHSLASQADKLRAVAGGDPATELTAYFERYLTAANRDDPGDACMFPSLAAEVARQGEGVRHVFTDGVRDYLSALGDISDRDTTDKTAPKNAIAILSTLVGAMVLARAVDDETLSDGILSAAKEALKSRYGQ